jgi:uncharacterized protein YbjT (DUF2867 family)
MTGERGLIGVTGATGQVGSRVARRLAAAGVSQRLVVRDTTRAPVLPDSEVVAIDGYRDSAGMRTAFSGISTLLLVSASEAVDRVEQHLLAADAAAAAGVGRIVYLSFMAAAPDATFTFARDHFHTEEGIRAGGLDFTFSRQSLYLDVMPFMATDSVIRGPAGDGRVAPVARDDVADSLVAMLTQGGHEGRTYNLTGPHALTMAEIAREISEATGQPVTFQNETLDEARASRAHYGAPAFEVEGWVTSYAAIAAGEMDVVTDTVRELTGHEPIGVRKFLRSGPVA